MSTLKTYANLSTSEKIIIECTDGGVDVFARNDSNDVSFGYRDEKFLVVTVVDNSTRLDLLYPLANVRCVRIVENL